MILKNKILKKYHKMNKIFLSILMVVVSISANSQSIFSSLYTNSTQIDDAVIEKVQRMLLSEQYKDCIDSCKYYLGYGYRGVGYEKHPYRNWSRNHRYHGNGVREVTVISYLGCLAAYQYSLSNFDSRTIFDGIEWARACVAISNDYLKEMVPHENCSAEIMGEYVSYGEMGIAAAQCGEEFMSIMGSKDKWGNKERKWFDKTSDEIYETLYKNLSNRESYYSEYPVLQYKITIISSANILNKSIYKNYKEIFKKRLDALTLLVNQNQNHLFDSEIYTALHSLTSMLTSTVVEGKVREKIGDNYERFCMEYLIKLKDISYILYGSSRYAFDVNYSLKDIQDNLGNDDCAIMHFEGPVSSGQYYDRYDINTRNRNWAFVITKNQEIPDLWHRGYIKDDKVNDLTRIKDSYPNIKRFYFVGTPRMSFIDIAGTDSSIVRLHSLSQLLHEHVGESSMEEITFIGDINYGTHTHTLSATNNKGAEIDNVFEALVGPAIELKHLKELFGDEHIRPVVGDNATKNIVASELSRSRAIIHISTHGAQLNLEDDFKPEELILKKNIMDNSRLILSGYNDNPSSPRTYFSGSDVLKIKKINTSVVFLDACSSGRGAVGVSGSVGISEAFHLIGAKNVICYLESVKDNIATQFSNMFYGEFSKGASCHDAFFKAKKSFNHPINVVLWE